ncbi:NACHT and WD domain protein [Nemania abortiva]|nr:NACHT and WD domain protein [Nemania abortiva]
MVQYHVNARMTDRPPATKPPQNEIIYSSPSDTTASIPQPRRDPQEQLGNDKTEIRETAIGSRSRWLPSRWGQKQQDVGQFGARGPFGLRLLHASPQPLIDIVFVHGLRGGSFKTWRKGDDPRFLWPQQWLPMEPDLRNASIYSFGYDSDWGSMNPSVLNVHDFGKTLYEELRSSPCLRQNSDSPIIMVGYSMGGLVIKKAYISAHQDQVDRQLAKRIRCIFFLATPHKGSDYASVLNRVLKISGVTGMTSPREYISELTRGSTSARLINEDFGRCGTDLHIYSFYETLETSLGVSSSLIVDKDSAVLGPGFKNEISRYLNANHRGICKFDSPEDPNYLSLKNSLSSAVQNLLRDVLVTQERVSKDQVRELQGFLGISAAPDDSHDRIEGSCQWINDRDDFKEWKDAEADTESLQSNQYTPSIYWVNANPGVGKTVLAAHVVSHLTESNLLCVFYHFHIGKRALQSLAGCLRSVAFQMATLNASIRTALLNLREESLMVDLDDARAVWLKVFKSTILQTPRLTSQFWVFDAIDECLGYAELFTFLKGLRSKFPLKIFITSRKLPDFPKLVRQIDNCVVRVVEIPVVDTMRDITLYIRDRMEVLPIDREEDKENLTNEILSKCNASFLWVRLVLDELESVYGYESMMSVLHSIPEGMISYYKRIISEISRNMREKHLIRAILIWVVCASRPLTISELAEALRIDIKVHLASPMSAIEGLCGQLVLVDKQTALVQIVHNTAREFLLSAEAEEFRISRTESNERLALCCLQLLVSPPMQPPKHRRLLGQKRQEHPSSPLLDYAITQFSEHILDSEVESNALLISLNRFLCTTVLSWVEKIVSQKHLHHLTKVARSLKGYLDRRAQSYLSLDRPAETIACWAEDLGRLVTEFGGALIVQPRSIYFLIPPLCPNETAIHKQFGRLPDGLKLSGFSNKDWKDCIVALSFEEDTAATVICDDRHIAIGFDLGTIQLYKHGSYQKEQIMKHAYPIERLALDPSGVFIVSASIKDIVVWDLDGNILWQKKLRSRCILLTATPSLVICVMMSAKAIWWDITTGEELVYHQYPYRALDSAERQSKGPTKAPFIGEFNPGLELLALAYQTGPICIYELQTHEWIAWVVDDNSRNVTHLTFNPSPDVNLLLVAYDDSKLSLYDPWYGTLIRSQQPDTSAILQALSCSPDGRTFATVDTQGHLRIWDFETLAMFYYVLTPTASFRTLTFTTDGLNLVDVVNQEMRIWAPSALIRNPVEREGSRSDQDTAVPVTAGQYKQFRSAKLRVAISHECYPILVSGNHNGDVMVYDQDGNQTGVLYAHSNSIIKCLALSRGNDIASSDTDGIMKVWQLDTSQLPVVRAARQRFQVHFKTAIRQVLFDDEGKYLLVSTTDLDSVYEVATGAVVGSLSFRVNKRQIWRWTCLQASDTTKRFVLVCDGSVKCYSALDFPSETAGARIKLEFKVDPEFTITSIDSITVHTETSSLIVDVSQRCGYLTSSILLIFRIPDLFNPEQPEVRVEPLRVLFSDYYMHFLGLNLTEFKLVFLHKNSWVCSVELPALADRHYTRHFFVPNQFTTRANEIKPWITRDKALIFALHDKFAVIKNGLVFQETVVQD